MHRLIVRGLAALGLLAFVAGTPLAQAQSAASSGTLALSASTVTAAQNSGAVRLTISRTGGSSGTVGVSYRTVNGSAVAGRNFYGVSGTVYWGNGDTSSKRILVGLNASPAFAGNKTFSIVLSDVKGGATLGKPSSTAVTVTGTSSTTASTVALAAASYAVNQTAGSVKLVVNRSGGATAAATVKYATANGSAVSGTNYTAASGTVSWAANDSAAKTVTIPVSTTAFTGTKTFTVALSGPTGATMGTPAASTVTITGSGATAASTVALSAATYGVTQSAGSVKVTVNRSGSATAAATVKYATANGSAASGTDYTAASGTLSWAANDATAKSVTVPVSTTAFTGSRTFTVTLSAASGATMGTPTSATVTIAGTGTTAPTTGLAIKVSGGHFVDGSGKTVQLRGVNVSGMEFAYMQHQSSTNPWAGATGTATPNWSLIRNTWKANAVRIPLNEDSWLSKTCTVGTNTAWDSDPGNNYKAVVIQSVKDATAAGLYVIVDLHWQAPDAYCGNQQNAMATTKSIAWWTDVANTFKAYPNVLFELFNEPFPEESSFGGPNDGAAAWSGLQNGLHLSRFSNTGYSDSAYSWNTVGMQDLIDAVRATGATNVVLAGGLDWSQNLSQWLTYRPTDTLNQMGAVWHAYGYKAYEGHSDQKSTVAAIVTAGFPVVITEYGDSNNSTTSPFASNLLPWSDTTGVSYMAWSFNPWGATSSNVLIKDAAGTPTQGFGNYVKTHYVCRDAGTASCP